MILSYGKWGRSNMSSSMLACRKLFMEKLKLTNIPNYYLQVSIKYKVDR